MNLLLPVGSRAFNSVCKLILGFPPTFGSHPSTTVRHLLVLNLPVLVWLSLVIFARTRYLLNLSFIPESSKYKKKILLVGIITITQKISGRILELWGTLKTILAHILHFWSEETEIQRSEACLPLELPLLSCWAEISSHPAPLAFCAFCAFCSRSTLLSCPWMCWVTRRHPLLNQYQQQWKVHYLVLWGKKVILQDLSQ